MSWTGKWRPRLIVAQIRDEARRVVLIFLYLWALFSLFQLHRWVVTEGEGMSQGQVVAIINAYVFAKVMFIGERLHWGEAFEDKPLIIPVLFKSALFAVTLMAFNVVEKIVVGLLHGKTFMESLPRYGDSGLSDAVALTVIMFVVLTPFFAFRELGRAIGAATLWQLFFARGARAALRRATRPQG